MARRALLIGAQTFGLEGVEHDLTDMDAAMRRRRFIVGRCEGPDATREGIIAAYERLIEDAVAGDAVLVYYTGHGGYAWPSATERVKSANNQRQFIVPTDFREPVDGDFRGITAMELSVLLARLTQRTDNAVVVLDCCHSAMMSRNLGEARVRQIRAVAYPHLEAHLRRRIAAGLRVDLLDPTGNKKAVRLAACASDEFAHETPGSDGRYGGLLTRALIQALDEAVDTTVSWSRLIARIRHLVQMQMPHQRPTIEGPFERTLFEVESAESAGWLFVTDTDDGRARIGGARLLGVNIGDEFAIMPKSADSPTDDGRIATVRIDAVELLTATGPLTFAGCPAPLPMDARAYRVTAAPDRVPARVPQWLVTAVNRSTFVRVAQPGEHAPLQVVESDDGALTVHDRIGPLHAPRFQDSVTSASVVRDLNRIGRATVLRGIRREPGRASGQPAVLDWGLERGSERSPLPPHGAIVHAGDLIYLRIRNNASRQLYVSLIDIGVAYATTVLTDLDPLGVRIAAGEEYVFGECDWSGKPSGVELTWPEHLPPDAPRPETILALVTFGPQDVSALHQEGIGGHRRQIDTALGALLAHFGAGATRDLRRTMHYWLHSIEFTLDPDVRQNVARTRWPRAGPATCPARAERAHSSPTRRGDHDDRAAAGSLGTGSPGTRPRRPHHAGDRRRQGDRYRPPA